MMKLKNLILASRLPFVTASVIPVILSIVWCVVSVGSFNAGYALLCITGVILVHVGANTLNDYFDWNFSDVSNPNVGPFNGGSRLKIGGQVERRQFLLISVVCLVLLVFIAVTFIVTDRFFVLYFSLGGFLLGFLYSVPPFRIHSRGFGEVILFMSFGPVLSAAVCYVMTGFVRSEHFLIGIPSGLATTAILWINQFPDYEADKSAGKKNLTVRLGLKTSRYIYVLLMSLVFLSTAFLIFYHIIAPWAALIVVLIPGCIKAAATLFKSYKKPKELIPAQGFTIQFQMLTTVLITIALVLGRYIHY
jgi:1,4-dihydroxy-2-naphthoate polyprenyltransferase